MRFRQAFAYQDFEDDSHHDQIVYMDEQQQEELIAQLRKDDLARNDLYCVLPPGPYEASHALTPARSRAGTEILQPARARACFLFRAPLLHRLGEWLDL
jgi:hypothetical protein